VKTKTLLLSLVALLALSLPAFGAKGEAVAEKSGQPGSAAKSDAKLGTDEDKFSYIIGADVGTNLRQQELKINFESFMKGLQDAVEGKELALSQEEMQAIFNAFREKMMAEMQKERAAQAEKNLGEGKTFLAENAKKPGVKTLPSGLQYLVVESGKGEQPKATDTVRTHYRGTFIDGTEFDSSYERNEPAEFPVTGVIKGWTEALQLMHVGDKWKLFIPSDLAYGPQGRGAQMPPNATLIFDIELLDIVTPGADASDGTIKIQQ
jgi:FKBP-type peptidyl-prolyl cis-trans isomerase FklB